ncbi:MAG: hypothetical protein AAF750_12560 [Planctomycetota bacterium]
MRYSYSPLRFGVRRLTLVAAAVVLIAVAGQPAHAEAYYAASGQGGREYSVFNDASTNAGSTPAGAFRIGFNGDGRERQYAAKFNFRNAEPTQTATLHLFAGSSTGDPDSGFQLDAGPTTQANGVTVGVFLDPTIADASARIDPRFNKPEGGTYSTDDSEFITDKSQPLAVFTVDQLDTGVTLDITQAFRDAMSHHGKLLLVLAPVNADAKARDQTYVFRSAKGNSDVPPEKRLRIETTPAE